MYGGIQSLTVVLFGQLLKWKTDLCFVFSSCVLEQYLFCLLGLKGILRVVFLDLHLEQLDVLCFMYVFAIYSSSL